MWLPKGLLFLLFFSCQTSFTTRFGCSFYCVTGACQQLFSLQFSHIDRWHTKPPLQPSCGHVKVFPGGHSNIAIPEAGHSQLEEVSLDTFQATQVTHLFQPCFLKNRSSKHPKQQGWMHYIKHSTTLELKASRIFGNLIVSKPPRTLLEKQKLIS